MPLRIVFGCCELRRFNFAYLWHCKSNSSEYTLLFKDEEADVQFFKMHGLGNDFVIFDVREDVKNLIQSNTKIESIKENIKTICHRNFGIGCDQLIVLDYAPDNNSDLFMLIFNPDGSQSGACGNATRCVASYEMKRLGKEHVIIETLPGYLKCTRAENGNICVNMGKPTFDWLSIPLSKEMKTTELDLVVDYDPTFSENMVCKPVAVNVGNPHCVFFVKDLDGFNIEKYGSKFEIDQLFPERTNVEFVQILDRQTMRMRVWERGAGVTLSCGSGACAVTMAGVRKHFIDDNVKVILDGGELDMFWNKEEMNVYMTGPVAYAFDGNYTQL